MVSNNIFIITLDDNSTIYSDIKIPENYSASIKKVLPVEVRLSSFKDKVFFGKIDFISIFWLDLSLYPVFLMQ